MRQNLQTLSRRGFLAAAVPIAAPGQAPDNFSPAAYAVVLCGRSNKFADGRPRISHVTPNAITAKRLVETLRKRPGFDAYMIRVAKGGGA